MQLYRIPNRGKITEPTVVLLMAVLAAGLLFNQVILSGFKESLMNIMDGRLLVRIVEHWFLFFKGDVPWRDMLFFYPLEGTLGFSDALFLYSIPYAILRIIGIDPYLAWDLVLFILAIFGYVTMYILLNRLLKVSVFGAHFGAVFFLLGAPMWTILNNSHQQLFAVWLLPLLMIFLSKAVRVRTGVSIKSFKWWILSCVLYGGIAYTGFYICWFFTLIAAIIGVVWMILTVIEKSSIKEIFMPRAVVQLFRITNVKKTKRVLFKWSLAAAVILIALLPFLVTYIPVNMAENVVHYGDYKCSQPGISGVFTPGVHNLMYGEYLREGRFQKKPFFWELSYGMTPGFVVFCFVGIALYFVGTRAKEENPDLSRILKTLLFASLITLLLILRFQDFSLWDTIRKFIPGATAIRAIFRFNILVYTCLLTIAVISWDNIWKKCTGFPILRGVIFVGVALLLVEQMGESPLPYRVNRINENNCLAKIAGPPDEIETFFLGPKTGKLMGQPEITAFRIGQNLKIPSIQGGSGIFPKNYNIHQHQVGTKAYYDAIRGWIRKNNIAGPIGELNLEDYSWKIHSVKDLLDKKIYCEFETNILKQAKLKPIDYLLSGWSNMESWGVWSDAKTAILEVAVEEVPEGPIQLNLSLNAFLPVQGHEVSSVISINGVDIMELYFNKKNPTVDVSFRVKKEQFIDDSLKIVFETKGNSSPADYGISEDERAIGIGLSSCTLNKIQ